MKKELDILRFDGHEHYRQVIPFETDDENATVASALTAINNAGNYVDSQQRPVGQIRWECSCLQKKCGACAMVINSLPRLACDTRLADCKGKITIEPLRKFPVIEDLIVDRSAMLGQLRDMQLWLEENAPLDEKSCGTAYEASRCLQCGCCLEVCPNFAVGLPFFGMSAAVPASRIIAESRKKEFLRQYKKHVYEGCGKSLACRNICPAGIDIEGLLVSSNAAAIWKR